jgi:hypothetical protein
MASSNFFVVASEAKQSRLVNRKGLDCFVARAPRNDELGARTNHEFAVIAREGGQSSIPETAVIEPRSRSVLDSPPSRGMTAM